MCGQRGGRIPKENEMITVYKYSLDNWKKNVCRVILPVGAEILKYWHRVYTKGEELNIWAKVDTAAAEEVCYFYVVKTGENISKRLEQRDKNKKLEYVGSFFDMDDTHWHIFKAAAASSSINSFTTTPYWGGNAGIKVQPFSTAPSWIACGNSTNGTSISSCCDTDSEGSVSLTSNCSMLTINKNDTDSIED